MVRGISQMFITGPDVVKAVTAEDVTHEELGGADSHASKSGVAHFVLESEEECMETIRHLLSFLPQNNLDDPPMGDQEDDPDRDGRRPARGRAGRPVAPVQHDGGHRAGGGMAGSS